MRQSSWPSSPLRRGRRRRRRRRSGRRRSRRDRRGRRGTRRARRRDRDRRSRRVRPSTHPPAASATAVESPAAAATAAATAAGAPAALVVLGGRVGADELAVLVADESALALRLRHGARDDEGIVASGCSAAGQFDRAAKGASAGRERAGAARAERRVSGLNPRRGDREHGRVSAHSRELEGFTCTRSWSAAVPNEEPWWILSSSLFSSETSRLCVRSSSFLRGGTPSVLVDGWVERTPVRVRVRCSRRARGREWR